MAKQKAQRLVVTSYDPTVYANFVDARLRAGEETADQILWNFTAALHSAVEEEEAFLRGAYGVGPFADKVKSAKKAKSAAAGGK